MIGGFFAGLACTGALMSVVEYGLTSRSTLLTGWSVDWPVVVFVVAIHGVSAAIGTLGQLAWLRAHRSRAAQAGAIAGVLSTVVFASLALLSASIPQAEEGALAVGRYFALLGPGLIVGLYSWAGRRREQTTVGLAV